MNEMSINNYAKIVECPREGTLGPKRIYARAWKTSTLLLALHSIRFVRWRMQYDSPRIPLQL